MTTLTLAALLLLAAGLAAGGLADRLAAARGRLADRGAGGRLTNGSGLADRSARGGSTGRLGVARRGGVAARSGLRAADRLAAGVATAAVAAGFGRGGRGQDRNGGDSDSNLGKLHLWHLRMLGTPLSQSERHWVGVAAPGRVPCSALPTWLISPTPPHLMLWRPDARPTRSSALYAANRPGLRPGRVKLTTLATLRKEGDPQTAEKLPRTPKTPRFTRFPVTNGRPLLPPGGSASRQSAVDRRLFPGVNRHHRLERVRFDPPGRVRFGVGVAVRRDQPEQELEEVARRPEGP